MRKLTLSDVRHLHALSTGAGWNQTRADWERILRLAPETCFAIEQDGRPVATSTLFCYGAELAWVGMVLTNPAYRRRGYARTLMQHTIDTAHSLGVRSLMLDATDEGHPLYASLGFVPVGPIQRWEGQPVFDAPADMSSLVSNCWNVSGDAFPVDRSGLLHELRAESDIADSADGFALGRPGERARYLGPCVAVSPQSASSLIQSALARGRGGHWFWDISPDNAAAVTLATRFDFAPVRHLRRMCLGVEPRFRLDHIFAIAGFEYG